MRVVIAEPERDYKGWFTFKCPYCGEKFVCQSIDSSLRCHSYMGMRRHASCGDYTGPDSFRVELESPLSIMAKRFR